MHELVNGLNEKPVYIHFDLDVLDPSCYRNVKCPVRNGLEIKDITRLLKKIALKQNIAGMSILENLELDQKRIRVIDDLFDFCLNL
jgi:arginase family enzyme